MKHQSMIDKLPNRPWRRIIPAVCAILACAAAPGEIKGQDFGIHFLGNTSDNVTGTAGVVPIANWNNIANSSYTIGTGTTILASDGTTTATLTMTGAGTHNAWNSGAAGDGANLSLMDGFMDTGSYGGVNAIATISGLTNAYYNVYIYAYPDQSRPSNGGDLLPNYTINGTTYYAPVLGNTGSTSYDTTGATIGGTGFSGFTPSVAALGNSTSKQPTANFGNYVELVLIAPINGAITIQSEKDATTYRSPMNGIELVPTSGAAPSANAPSESPASASVAAVAGTSVTLTASASGTAPISYAWQTDGGSGGALTNIPGASSTNLVVNTTGWAPGTYNYDFVARNSLGTNASPGAIIKIATVLMEDIGTNAPTPGANDVSQLLNTDQVDDGLNYYTDNGANNNEWNGQTFTTGNAQAGYVLNTLAWKTAGNGNSFSAFQLYDLYIYSLGSAGTTATLVASYQGYGGGNQLDWMQWVGLNTPLAPNSQYAYTLGRDTTSGGWEHIGNQGNNPYAGGQICEISSAGGTVTYGTAGGSDATFDIGLSISQAPFANLPSYSPAVTPVYAGTPITLNENPVGVPPLTYQWLADNGTGTLSPVSGGNSSNLVVNTTSLAPGNYEYAITVSNAHGTSTSATLTVTVVAGSAPQLVTDITPNPTAEGYVGQPLTFSASFTGTLPITYQWLLDTGNGSGPQPISGVSNPTALTSTLVLTNLQLANAGTYSLTANNSMGGPISSSSTVLTVLADPAAPPANSYGAMVLGEKPVAYWRFNEMEDPSTGVLPAYDASGNGFHGVYGQYAEDGFDGITGPQAPAFPGFESTNSAFAAENNLPDSWVTVPPMNLNTNTVTMAMWIYPIANEPVNTGLLVNRPYGAGFGFGGNLNSAGMADLGYIWNNNNEATWGFNSGLYPLTGQWSFVALVIQPTQATIYLYYIDPVTGQPDLYSSVNAVANIPAPFTAGSLTTIGTDNQYHGSSANAAAGAFSGSIDEVSVFNSALTQSQVLALFSKGAGLSEIAATISGQPESQDLFAGGTANFSVAGVNGSSPLTYQWQFNGANITGATNISLSISNLTTADSGSYQLFVTNPLGTTNSTPATLLVEAAFANSYDATVLANGPLAYWKLNETNDPSTGEAIAYDLAGGFNGTYQPAAENGFNGVLAPQPPEYTGFAANQTALETFANTVDSYVTASAGTIMASNLTYVMWINPNAEVGNFTGLLFDRGGPGTGLGFGGEINGDGMSEIGYTWNQNTTWSFNSGLFPALNQWSLVAVTIAPSQATLYLMDSNGVQTAVNEIPHDAEEFGVDWHIGDDGQYADGSRTFPGSISSVAVYLATLSGSQLTSLYNAGLQITAPVTLQITPVVGGSLNLSWSQGTLLQSTNLLGPWVTNSAAVSPYVVAPTNSQMYFRVRVK